MSSTADPNVYQHLRFLFKIDYIQPTDGAPEECPNGHWHPPTSSRDFQTTGSTGWLLRTPNEIITAPNINGFDFGTCSLFYTSETAYYLGVPEDCRTICLEDWFSRYNAPWNRVMFTHQAGNLSIMKFCAEDISLAGYGSNYWMPELVPEVYNPQHPSPQPVTHLAGNLALIVAFVAFACPNMGNTAELQSVMNGCFQPPYWRPHGAFFRRQNRRGVVVNIRLDPSLPPDVSSMHLHNFQTGAYGALIR